MGRDQSRWVAPRRTKASTRPSSGMMGVLNTGFVPCPHADVLYIHSFKVGRVGDEELFGKLQVNV